MLSDILNASDAVNRESLKGCTGMHESVLVNYQLLYWLKELMELGAPTPVVLRLMQDVWQAWSATQDLLNEIDQLKATIAGWNREAERAFVASNQSKRRAAGRR